MKILYLDIETTGLNWNHCQVLEVGAIFDDWSHPKPLEDLPKFHCYINHYPIVGEPYALALHRNILHGFANKEYPYISPHDFVFNFGDFLKYQYGDEKSITVAGKNVSGFDFNFLDKLPNVKRDGGAISFCSYKFRQRVMDPGILYFDSKIDDKIPDLKTCLERAKIYKDVPHTSIGDCLLVAALLRKFYDVVPLP